MGYLGKYSWCTCKSIQIFVFLYICLWIYMLHIYSIYQDLDDIFKNESSMSYLFGRARGICFPAKKHQKRFVIVLHILMDLHSYRWWLHHPQNSLCEIWLFSVWFPILTWSKSFIHWNLGAIFVYIFWTFPGCHPPVGYTYGEFASEIGDFLQIHHRCCIINWIDAEPSSSWKLQPFISQK